MITLNLPTHVSKYRTNRKSGLISKETNQGLETIGDSLDLIILHWTPPTLAAAFGQSEQEWVSLCFLDPAGDWSYLLLNSGKTQGLSYFLAFVDSLASPYYQYQVQLQLTPRLSSGGNILYYYYDFAMVRKFLSAEEIRFVESLLVSPPFPLIMPDCDIPFPAPEIEIEHPVSDIQMLPWHDSRVAYLIWF